MEWSEVLRQKAIQKRIQRGKPTPFWDNRPLLFPDVVYIWDGFLMLSKCRTAGYSSVNPIQMSEIKAYVELFSIDDTQNFVQCVCALDAEYLELMSSKRKSTKPVPEKVKKR